MKLKKYNWLITREQINACDFEGAIISVDPEQIPDTAIPGLFGAVRLRVEGATGPADVFADSAARKFFKAMHQRWPWPGFFLRLEPVTAKSPYQKIVDLSVFMAVALCHCNTIGFCETRDGQVLKYNPGELGKILAEFQGRAVQLADTVGISDEAIQRREAIIAESVISFFAAGKSLNPKLLKQQITQINHRRNIR